VGTLRVPALQGSCEAATLRTAALRNFSTVPALVAMTNDTSVHPPRTLTPEQRKARDAERRADAAQAMREHEAAQKAFHANMERLRAERLAREARDRDGRSRVR
jgi:hypothetical protein